MLPTRRYRCGRTRASRWPAKRNFAVLDLPGLIQAKRAAGRQKDLAALPEIEGLLEAGEP